LRVLSQGQGPLTAQRARGRALAAPFPPSRRSLRSLRWWAPRGPAARAQPARPCHPQRRRVIVRAL